MTHPRHHRFPPRRALGLIVLFGLLLGACSWLEAEPEPTAAPTRTPAATPRPTPRPTPEPTPERNESAAASAADEDADGAADSQAEEEPPPEPTPEGPVAPDPVLRIGTGADVGSWDPLASTPASATYYAAFYETLVRFRFGFPSPSLARGWEFDEEGVLFTLRGDAVFHDGTPVDADAVVFNLERLLADPGQVASELAPVTGVSAVDERTVRLELARAAPSLFWALADPRASIVSPSAVDELADGPVGTGVFRYDDAAGEPGVSVVGEWWPEYHDLDSVHFGQVVFRVLPDPAARLAAYQAGELDIATGGSIDSSAYGAAGAAIASLDLGGSALVFLDRADGGVLATSDRRRAVAHAVDRDSLASALGANGLARASVYRDGNYGDGSLGIDYDPGSAADLAAGSDAVELSMPTTSALGSAPALLQAQLAEVGIVLELIDLEAPPPTPEPTPIPTPPPPPELDEDGEPIPTPTPEPTPPPTPTPPPLPPDLDSACVTTDFSLCIIDVGLIHPFELYQRFWASDALWNPAGADAPDVTLLANNALAEPDPGQAEIFWSDMAALAEERDVLLTYIAGDELPIAYDPTVLFAIDPMLSGGGAVVLNDLRPVPPSTDESDDGSGE